MYRAGAELFGDDRLEVGLGDLDLAVGELLEPDEGLVERVALQVQAHLGERVAEGVAARVLPEHDLRGLLADGGGVDDLVGLAVREDAVLVDAGLVREGVAPDDGLVVLDRVAGQAGHEPRRPGELLGAHADVDAGEEVAARADRHDDLLERGVAGALAEAVDRALDLACTGDHAGERVGDRHAEVVVAVRRHDVVARDRRHDVCDQLRVLVRNAEADGVGDVERCRAVVDGELQDVAHEVDVGPAGVLGRELDVGQVALGAPDGARRPRPSPALGSCGASSPCGSATSR